MDKIKTYKLRGVFDVNSSEGVYKPLPEFNQTKTTNIFIQDGNIKRFKNYSLYKVDGYDVKVNDTDSADIVIEYKKDIKGKLTNDGEERYITYYAKYQDIRDDYVVEKNDEFHFKVSYKKFLSNTKPLNPLIISSLGTRVPTTVQDNTITFSEPVEIVYPKCKVSDLNDDRTGFYTVNKTFNVNEIEAFAGEPFDPSKLEQQNTTLFYNKPITTYAGSLSKDLYDLSNATTNRVNYEYGDYFVYLNSAIGYQGRLKNVKSYNVLSEVDLDGVTVVKEVECELKDYTIKDFQLLDGIYWLELLHDDGSTEIVYKRTSSLPELLEPDSTTRSFDNYMLSVTDDKKVKLTLNDVLNDDSIIKEHEGVLCLESPNINGTSTYSLKMKCNDGYKVPSGYRVPRIEEDEENYHIYVDIFCFGYNLRYYESYRIKENTIEILKSNTFDIDRLVQDLAYDIPVDIVSDNYYRYKCNLLTETIFDEELDKIILKINGVELSKNGVDLIIEKDKIYDNITLFNTLGNASDYDYYKLTNNAVYVQKTYYISPDDTVTSNGDIHTISLSVSHPKYYNNYILEGNTLIFYDEITDCYLNFDLSATANGRKIKFFDSATDNSNYPICSVQFEDLETYLLYFNPNDISQTIAYHIGKTRTPQVNYNGADLEVRCYYINIEDNKIYMRRQVDNFAQPIIVDLTDRKAKNFLIWKVGETLGRNNNSKTSMQVR